MKKPITLFIILLTCIPLFDLHTVSGQNLLYKESINPNLSHKRRMVIPLPAHLMNKLNINRLPTKKKNQLKSTTAQKTFVDTVIVYSNLANDSRYLYNYDTANNCIQIKMGINENNNVWTNNTLDTLTYDSVGNVLCSTWKNWSNNGWSNSSRTLSTYGFSHTLLTKKDQIWQNGKWDNSDSGTYSYNQDNKVLSYYLEVWNDSTWTNKTFQLYTYDSLGRMTAAYYQSWADSVWMNDQRYLYNYDSAGNTTSAMLQKADLQEWKNYYKEIYSYDSASNETSYLSMFWNDIDNVWTNSEKYTYTYNIDGNISTGIGEDWNDTVWVNSQKGDYTYDTYGGVQSALTQYWSDSDSAWVDTTLSVYNYDIYGDALMGDYYTGTSQSWNQDQDGLLTIPYNYDLESNYYTGYHIDAHYITPVQAGPEGVKNYLNNTVNHFSCNPNPISSQATLSIGLKQNVTAEIDIFDLNGKRLQTLYRGTLSAGEHQITFNIESRKPGIYLLALISGKESESIKLIKR